MSMIKRYLDNLCEEIANRTGHSWDEVMDTAARLDYDMKLVELHLKNGGKRNAGTQESN